MNKIKTLITVAVAIFSVTAHAQDALNYSLRDCISRGLESNYQLQISRNQEQVAHNNATLANAGALPTVDISAGARPSFHNSERSTARSTGVVTTNSNVFDKTLDATVALNWTIFDGFKIQTNYRQLQLLEKQGETSTRIDIEDLIADIASEYYNYVQQVIRCKNYKYAMELSRERLRIAELNYQTGRFSGLDYHQAEVDFRADSSAYMRQVGQTDACRVNLNQLMSNTNVDQKINVADTSIVVRSDLDIESLWQQTLSRNLSLLYASQNTMLAEQDYKKVLSRNYPYVKLNIQYGYTANFYDINTIRQREVLGLSGGLTVGFNLFDGNRKRERRNADIAIQNRQLQRDQLELSLHASLVKAWQAFQTNTSLIELQRQNLKIAESNLEIAMERFKLGNLSGFDMRQVQKNLIDVEEKVLQAEYDAKIYEISLMLISGDIDWYLR